MMLRDFEMNDALSLIQHANNKKVSRYLTSKFPYPYTDRDARWWLTIGRKKGLNKAIVLNDECIGGIGVTFGEDEQRYTALIGYWVGEAHWGKGIATLAVRQLTDDVLAEGKVVRLSAPVFGPNKASMRVLEKCGYHHECTQEKAVFKDHQFMDLLTFTKLRA